MNKRTRLASLLAVLLCVAVGITAALGLGCDKKKKPRVVLIIIDTLPAKHSSLYGYERSTTTYLERLAKDGITFEHAVSAAPWTLPSIASILTGDYPSRHFAGMHLDPWQMKDRRLASLRPEVVTLAQLFKEHGYKTVGFFNNPFVHPDFKLDKGFDTYDYVGGDNLNIRRAKQVTQDAVRWMELNGDDPFFMVVHYFDPHLAYDPPIDFALPYVAFYQGKLKAPFNPELADVRSGALQLSDEDKKYIEGLYDGEVAGTDAEMGRLLVYLKSKGWYDSSLIIVTADHGEEFWEHGGFEHGHSLHRELLEVPLVMKYPGSDFAGKKVGEYVSLTDIFPTVAEMMEWPIAFKIDGTSLYPKGGTLNVLPQTIVAENIHYGPQQQAFYAEGYKLVVERETGKTVVYDLKNDPGETKDVLGEVKLPESVKNQVQKIASDLGALVKEQSPEAAKLDKETVDKLKSLGYIQ